MNSNFVRRMVCGATIALVLNLPQSVLAQGGKEIQVAGRTLGFLDNAPTGKVVIAIVFDGSKPASIAEKDEVLAAFGSGIAAGGATVNGRAVEAGNIAGVGDAVAIYMTHGVNYAAIGQVARSKKIMSISSDMACVQSGACVMGVAVSPKVDIVINHAAATATGTSFKAAFKMMIREI